MYRHSFDLGLYAYFGPRDSTSGWFYHVHDGLSKESFIFCIPPEHRLIPYNFESMRPA